MERTRLPNHTGVSGAPIHGWPAVLFGLPFVGIWVLLRILDPEPNPGVPPIVLDAVAWAFGLAGCYLVVLGVGGLFRAARRRAFLRDHPNEPWLADHDWDSQVVRDDTWRRVRRALFGAALFGVFLVPFNWWAFLSDDGPLLVQIITGVFDLIASYAVGYTLLIVWRALRFGSSRARLDHFPFFLGEELGCTLDLNADVRGFDALEITLRCVEERYETTGTGKNRSTKVVCYQVHGETRSLDPQSRDPFAVRFELPADGESTRLSERPATFWELEVKGERSGVDFLSAFNMPVYARDGVPEKSAVTV